MNFVYCEEAETVAPKATEWLNGILRHEFGRDILLLLAGGSSLALYDHIATQNLGSHITFAVTDERFSHDAKVNNFAQLATTTFFSNAAERNCAYIDTRVRPEETIDTFAERFDAAFHAWYAVHSNGYTIAVLGVGTDGHTVGIMPYPDDHEYFEKTFDSAERWVVGYDAGDRNPHPLRATVTSAFLRTKVDAAVVYAIGKEKRSILKQLMKKHGSCADMPAWILREMKTVTVFSDQKA